MTSPEPTHAYIENRHLRLGIDLRIGGAITHLSESGQDNLINSWDWGRQIQQSYYSGPKNYRREGKEKAAHWDHFPWNPIQAGDHFGNGSRIVGYEVGDGRLHVTTVPMLWPMRDDPGECRMETWIELDADAPAFTYRARLSNARSDHTSYPPYPQELPAIYTNATWDRLLSYCGDQPFTGAEPSELRNDHSERWPWVKFLGTEGWAALLDAHGRGLGVCVAEAAEFHGGFSGQRGVGGEKDVSTGYVAPIRSEILDHDIVYDYTCRMLVGSVAEIRAEARRCLPTTLPTWSFHRSRQGWTFNDANDAGWAAEGLTVHATTSEQPVRLVGPVAFWRAEAAPGVAVHIATPRAGTLHAYWRGMPPQAALPQSLWLPWKESWWSSERSVSTELDAGSDRWVVLPLAGHPAYQGGLTGLALDVPDGATVRAVRLLDDLANPSTC